MSDIPGTSSSPSSAAIFASMGLSAFGSIITTVEQYKAIKANGDYEESIAKTNAAIATLQAKQAIAAGDVEAARVKSKTDNMIASERAVQGASGLDVASGSNALVRNATKNVGAMDALTIKNNAARQAWGFQTEAIQDSYKGQFAKLTATANAHQTILNGGLRAIEGPLAIESSYLRFSRYINSAKTDDGVPFDMATK